jgi:repressor LexA
MTATPTAPPPLTNRQQEVLDFITDFADRHGYNASVRDIQAGIGAASPNGAVCHLVPLRKKGFITWDERTARSIRPVEVRHAATT